VRHYTSRSGLKGIEASGSIKASDNNRVYLEPAKKKPLGEAAVRDKYQIHANKGRDYVETDAPEELVEWIKNPRYHTYELTVKGDLKLNNPTFVKRK
jgi:hypothetical protein